MKIGLTVHLDFNSAISCDDKGGRSDELGRMCVGDVLKLAHSREGCHHCNQFRLEKLHPRLLHLQGMCWTEMETEKVKQGFICKEITKCNSWTVAA